LQVIVRAGPHRLVASLSIGQMFPRSRQPYQPVQSVCVQSEAALGCSVELRTAIVQQLLSDAYFTESCGEEGTAANDSPFR
jgi:hypothetical protein